MVFVLVLQLVRVLVRVLARLLARLLLLPSLSPFAASCCCILLTGVRCLLSLHHCRCLLPADVRCLLWLFRLAASCLLACAVSFRCALVAALCLLAFVVSIHSNMSRLRVLPRRCLLPTGARCPLSLHIMPLYLLLPHFVASFSLPPADWRTLSLVSFAASFRCLLCRCRLSLSLALPPVSFRYLLSLPPVSLPLVAAMCCCRRIDCSLVTHQQSFREERW